LGKHNIDDILSELGLGDEKPKTPPAQTSGDKGGQGLASPGGSSNDGVTARPPDSTKKASAKKDPDEPLGGGLIPAEPGNQKHFGTRPTQAQPSGDGAGTSSLAKSSAKPDAGKADAAKPVTIGPAMSTVYQPAEGDSSGDSLGKMLVARGAVAADKVQTAEQICKSTPGKKFVDVLLEQGADEASVLQCVAEQARIPFERISLEKGLDGGFDGKLLQRLSVDYCRQHMVIPIRMDGTRAVIGSPDPHRVFLVDEIKERLRVASVKMVMTPAFDVRGAIEIVGGGQTGSDSPDIGEILEDTAESDVQVEDKKSEEINLEKEAADAPVIRYVNHIINTAVKEGASDIHVEPAEKKVRVRFRIDGELFEMMNPPGSFASAITSRLKIMANLDISERRLPQDGRIRCNVQGRKLDLRVSTLPNGYGEKTVMRILDTKSINVELEQLGFDENVMDVWRKQIDSPHGIVLVTGPTGSGKTTTLYASLRKLDKNSMNISTVEDPVEYHLDGLTQTQMHEKIGMTFARALKALLRQDPDVIMLGEIRDAETAQTAVQAALTGHLVLSTLHTNDAPSSITRLVNIGVEPFLASAAVNAVLAQRLIRKLCTHCKAQEPPAETLREYLEMQGMDTELVWVPKGCDKCRKIGYSGRVGIYELLAVDNQLRDIIARNPSAPEFTRICIERGMVTLQQDGLKKVAKGVTTVDEVLRVTKEGH
jgi:type IV pilus assembly protein PilB